MKAAQINSYGSKESLTTNSNVKIPVPQSNEVLVEVHAAGVNPFDWKVREGYMKDFIPLNLPATLGGDVAGVVTEVGAEATGFQLGQEVFGLANAAGGQGAFADFTAVKATQLAPKPKNLVFVTAAALPLAAVSAYQAIVDHMDLQKSQTILIHGGAGGIGSFAIQIAKNLGAKVVTTVAESDTEYVLSLGADKVIDYQHQDFSADIARYDAVFDTISGETNKKSYLVVKNGGVLVSMVDESENNLAQEKKITYVHQSTIATNTRLNAIKTLVEEGKLKVHVDKIFNLDEVADGLEYLRIGHPNGKVVIKVK